MNIEEFVNNLKRDKARGNLAPHQIILLIALSNIYFVTKSNSTDVSTLNIEFQKVWNTYKNEFTTTNNKLGLPLKAFVNKGYITIEISEEINDFRNLLELESKISNLVTDDILIKLFKTDNIEEYLISRISK
jgi:hypothetical protein